MASSDPHPSAARRGAALSLAASLVWPVQAALIAAVLAGLVMADHSGVPDALRIAPLWAGLGLFALAALRAGLEAGAQRALSRAAEAQLASLRAEVVTREMAAAQGSGQGGPGALAALACEKLEALRPYLMRYRPARLRSVVMPLGILALALWQSWAVALVLAVAGPLIPVFMALVGIAAKSASDRQMAEVGALSDLLVDRLAALADLRLIGAGAPVVADFARASEDLRGRTMAVLRIAFLSSTVLELFAALGVAMVAVWVGFSLLGVIQWGAWGAPLTPWAGMFLLLMAPEFFQPLRDLAAAWHDKAGADAVLRELEAWRAEDRPERPGAGGTAPARAARPGCLEVQGAVVQRGAGRIAYPDLRIAAGQSLALTGPSGAGKSTLLRLLAGLEAPAEGQVLLDGAPLDAAGADAWRARVGWMPQAPQFLNRSVRHNIGFGAPLQPEVIRAARLAPVLARLPRGDLTLLGERGAGLSGGEARRVMLARALQGGPDILLADEPTADLDPETAQAIGAALLEFAARGGTLVVATHDRALAARMQHTVDLSQIREEVAA